MVKWQVDKHDQLVPTLDGQSVTWAPQPGSQEAFLTCPVTEVLLHAGRGTGKTDSFLMDYAQEVGKGWGQEWRGIIFRRTYPELEDIINKSLKWFPLIFPGAQYNKQSHTWTFKDKESVRFRHFAKPSDYFQYHGHQYCFIGWEELTNWPDDKCYKSMISCFRSPVKGIPMKYRATTNPYGSGHGWVRKRWQLPTVGGKIIGPIIKDPPTAESPNPMSRVAIQGSLSENKVLLHAQPDYRSNIIASAQNESQLRAWLYGDWNVVAGGMFSDLWEDKYHVIPHIPFDQIPKRWRWNRAYDHGQSAPFSVGWFVESNGEPIKINDRIIGELKGDVIQVAEWYGCGKEDNTGLNMLNSDIAHGILDREDDWGIRRRVHAGPADSAIFSRSQAQESVAKDMEKVGVRWEPVDKGPGSRVQGWQRMREYMAGSIPVGGFRETPGMFITERCKKTIDQLPTLPRDEKNLDDVNSDVEDHIADMFRYRLWHTRKQAKQRRF